MEPYRFALLLLVPFSVILVLFAYWPQIKRAIRRMVRWLRPSCEPAYVLMKHKRPRRSLPAKLGLLFLLGWGTASVQAAMPQSGDEVPTLTNADVKSSGSRRETTVVVAPLPSPSSDRSPSGKEQDEIRALKAQLAAKNREADQLLANLRSKEREAGENVSQSLKTLAEANDLMREAGEKARLADAKLAEANQQLAAVRAAQPIDSKDDWQMWKGIGALSGALGVVGVFLCLMVRWILLRPMAAAALPDSLQRANHAPALNTVAPVDKTGITTGQFHSGVGCEGMEHEDTTSQPPISFSELAGPGFVPDPEKDKAALHVVAEDLGFAGVAEQPLDPEASREFPGQAMLRVEAGGNQDTRPVEHRVTSLLNTAKGNGVGYIPGFDSGFEDVPTKPNPGLSLVQGAINPNITNVAGQPALPAEEEADSAPTYVLDAGAVRN